LVEEGVGDWRRVIVEKPFGRDHDSAHAEPRDQAGDRTETNLPHRPLPGQGNRPEPSRTFRFANGIFEPVWNRRYIDHIQITASEKVGAE